MPIRMTAVGAARRWKRCTGVWVNGNWVICHLSWIDVIMRFSSNYRSIWIPRCHRSRTTDRWNGIHFMCVCHVLHRTSTLSAMRYALDPSNRVPSITTLTFLPFSERRQFDGEKATMGNHTECAVATDPDQSWFGEGHFIIQQQIRQAMEVLRFAWTIRRRIGRSWSDGFLHRNSSRNHSFGPSTARSHSIGDTFIEARQQQIDIVEPRASGQSVGERFFVYVSSPQRIQSQIGISQFSQHQFQYSVPNATRWRSSDWENQMHLFLFSDNL